MERIMSARIYAVDRELPIEVVADSGETIGYKYEENKDTGTFQVRLWSGHRTWFVPVDRLDCLELDL